MIIRVESDVRKMDAISRANTGRKAVSLSGRTWHQVVAHSPDSPKSQNNDKVKPKSLFLINFLVRRRDSNPYTCYGVRT